MRKCCVAGLLVCSGMAIAQPAPTASGPTSTGEDSTATFEAGRKLLAQDRPAEACAKFARALELEAGNVGVMLNLGLCNEQQDKLATALRWFRRALATASERQLTGSARAAGEKVTALARTVATVRLTLLPPGSAARVTVDGEAVADADFARVELDAGHHMIEASAPGGAAVRREVDLSDGVTTPVEIVLRAPAAVASSTGAQVAPPGRRGAYIAGAIGGGLVLGSVALGLIGRSAARSTDHPDVQRSWQAAVRYGGTSLFVVGSVGVGWAVWSLLRPREEPGRADRTVMVPVAGDRAVGVEVRGAF